MTIRYRFYYLQFTIRYFTFCMCLLYPNTSLLTDILISLSLLTGDEHVMVMRLKSPQNTKCKY